MLLLFLSLSVALIIVEPSRSMSGSRTPLETFLLITAIPSIMLLIPNDPRRGASASTVVPPVQSVLRSLSRSRPLTISCVTAYTLLIFQSAARIQLLLLPLHYSTFPYHLRDWYNWYEYYLLSESKPYLDILPIF